jgi:carbonic anhydrase/acetyltransferase-like protein (isoleucine patch superfamily)
MIYTLDQHRVKTVGDNFYVAPNATVIGQVELGEDVSVWFGAVIRGDVEKIIIGKGSNIQDLSVLHVDSGSPIIIGENVTVGHKVMLHGCTIGNNSLIGINSVILNNVEIGNNCLIGANTLLTEGTKIPDNSLVMGSPGKVKKEVDENLKIILKGSAEHYAENGKRFKSGLKEEN